MADTLSVSGTDNPYVTQHYSASSNEKNTMTIESYFKLLAAQLQNQDMTNPMSNSEMMEQMTQMAMVQSLSSMTEAVNTSMSLTTQTYAAGLVGQEITVAVTEDNSYGQPVATGVKYGVVESVNFVGGSPTFRVVGDDKDYSLSYLVGMGRVDDPYKKDEEEPGEDGPGEDGPGNDGSGDNAGEPAAVNNLFANLSKKENVPF